jgi:RNA-directed DNA polymerase
MLNPKKYKPGLIKRVWIPKVNSKELRPLGIPPVLDRMLQAVVHLALDPIIEEISDQYSYGSRKYRSPHDAITRVRTLLDKPKSPKWILDLDISKCFDNIKHNVIIEKLNP